VIVIFDLDGTVWDSEAGIVASLEHTFTVLGLPVPNRSTLQANIGPPLQLMLEELGVPAGLVEAGRAAYRERYLRHGVYEAALYPGVVEAIDAIAAAGHRLATATSKGEVPTRVMLEHFGILDRFEVVGAATMDRTAITKEAVLARALAALGTPDPTACRMIGDRHYDVHGAADHGIACIGVTWGYGDERELRDAGATAIASSPAELPLLLAAG
jgi:phosphoglycolate phosphatase